MNNVLVICGPTTSGKTSLALSIAKQIISNQSLRGAKRRGPLVPEGVNLTPPGSVNLLSADSRQIYKGLDIVTGKDIPTDLPPNICFFGLDLVEPNQSFNLADYLDYSKKIIQSSIKSHTPLIIVGGTGLYLKAITTDLLTVRVPPNRLLRLDLEKLDLPALQSRLSILNPQKFSSLNNSDLNNPRRLIRAIEISTYDNSQSAAFSSSNVIASFGTPNRGNLTPSNFLWVGLKVDKEIQKSRINHRVIDRLENGAVEEVKNLIAKYPDLHLPIYTSLGVKQILQFLHQEIPRETLVDLWAASEVDYARRQTVWFKKQPGIVWYDKSTVDDHLIAKLAEIYK
ncbi:hypothetical protein A3K29_01910 [Candidatus Collierbacteria bacterium RIFOXYB2_FULL_46_14]|uniref:tRNA dimethylallyltransferase n=1 Tax=Candidatus Collierbacteria bacterium GW2011_GWA2_46_26 TaxID=1618381 RepID=A0A0G1SHU5_9BACT|nr:MAG: tRNA dimethylallyltransferase [Candidatus Collierbacteria bacterium GW2011_GWC2_44_13]KKU32905.1 MAG: tRNA dimethylallyltransferase [Candidatus Collierbacteria bacterium GW2011_GWA2_46_26]OGD72883.1 MAG: hypothetical protein A3K29_01910 [Candidatus Collierbacteria bacterium RIFOXYB2_FULL_46_14]OGD75925.1 MAG: hypothetical protein A3K43_01910 [Candidatus Collierbacteria bacterium RIFOXYA2_FULL_46_20]OGD77261.1 MAG: hypothetical protein A3K39_01910 [Candidatus Collierbacteria bacterium RI